MQHEFGEDHRTKVQQPKDIKVEADQGGFEEIIKYFTVGAGKGKPIYEKIPNEVRKRIQAIRETGVDPEGENDEYDILGSIMDES